MTTVKIALPDDQAEALKAKAAAQGLSLEDWFRHRADQETRSGKGRYTLSELIQQCDPNVKFSYEDREWIGSPAV
jgi:hypothetical protein